MKRSAFTLIELIFAIMIIAIAVMSLPMMSQTATDSIEGSIVQEAIFAASTELNQGVTYKWDDNSTDSGFSTSRVIWTSTNDCNQTTKLRDGHINQPKHRRCSDNNYSVMQPSVIGSDSGDLDDLDDLNGSTTELFITSSGSSTSAQGYKNEYNRTISVDYVAFGEQDTTKIDYPTTAISKDMKEIKITITDDGNIVTQLKTYSANIGEVDIHSKVY